MGKEQGRFTVLLVVVGVSVGLLASGCSVCSGDSPDSDKASACEPGPSGGTGAVGGGDGSNLGGDSGAPASSCNELELRSDAHPVTVTATEEAAPAPTGGEIASGTYFYSAEIIYESAGTAPMTFPPSQVTVSGDGWQEVVGFENGPRHVTKELTTSGHTFTLSPTCPTGGSVESGTYTATDTSITFYTRRGSFDFARVFSKQ